MENCSVFFRNMWLWFVTYYVWVCRWRTTEDSYHPPLYPIKYLICMYTSSLSALFICLLHIRRKHLQLVLEQLNAQVTWVLIKSETKISSRVGLNTCCLLNVICWLPSSNLLYLFSQWTDSITSGYKFHGYFILVSHCPACKIQAS